MCIKIFYFLCSVPRCYSIVNVCISEKANGYKYYLDSPLQTSAEEKKKIDERICLVILLIVDIYIYASVFSRSLFFSFSFFFFSFFFSCVRITLFWNLRIHRFSITAEQKEKKQRKQKNEPCCFHVFVSNIERLNPENLRAKFTHINIHRKTKRNKLNHCSY